MKKTQIIALFNAVGVVASTVSGVYATVKACRTVREIEEDHNYKLDKVEIVRSTWKHYIPTAILTTGTVLGIAGNEHLNGKTQASLMGACAVLSEAYNKYKDSAAEVFGDDADEKIVRNYLKNVRETERDISEEISTTKHKIRPEDEKLGYDFFTDRYFETSYEVTNRAVGNILADSYRKDVTINDFYRYLKIDPIPGGDVLGWKEGDNPQIEVYSEYLDDGLDREPIEVVVVDYHKPPYRVH